MADEMAEAWKWWVGGNLVPAADAAIPAADHGIIVGDGCFETTTIETIRKGGIQKRRAFALTRHLQRLEKSMKSLGMAPIHRNTVRAAVNKTVKENTSAGLVRITVTGGDGPLGSGPNFGESRLIVAVAKAPDWAATTSIVTVSWPRNERGALAGVKSTSYAENVIALAQAKETGATEAIFPNTLGMLCEGTGTNIFVEHEGLLVTPPLSSGCLAGVTRALVLEGSAVVQADLPIEVLTTTKEAFLTSSTRDVMPITGIDGRDVDTGPLTKTARDTYAKLKASNLNP